MGICCQECKSNEEFGILSKFRYAPRSGEWPQKPISYHKYNKDFKMISQLLDSNDSQAVVGYDYISQETDLKGGTRCIQSWNWIMVGISLPNG